VKKGQSLIMIWMGVKRGHVSCCRCRCTEEEEEEDPETEAIRWDDCDNWNWHGDTCFGPQCSYRR
jgi:hypothetical protein